MEVSVCKIRASRIRLQTNSKQKEKMIMHIEPEKIHDKSTLSIRQAEYK